MYIFGGGIMTFFITAQHIFSGEFINAFLQYFVMSALPPTSIGQIITQAIVGASVAGLLWFIAMAKRVPVRF